MGRNALKVRFLDIVQCAGCWFDSDIRLHGLVAQLADAVVSKATFLRVRFPPELLKLAMYSVTSIYRLSICA